jgi:hypothetical protein
MRCLIRYIPLCCLILLASLTSCQYEELRAFLGNPQDVQEIQFAQRRSNRLYIVKRVTEPGVIARILSGVQVGKEVPYCKHPFRDTMIVVKKNNSRISVDFEYIHNHAAIRIRHKQYRTSKSTIDLLQSFYARSDNEASPPVTVDGSE